MFGVDPVGSGIALNASFSSPSWPIELTEIRLLWQRGADNKGVIDVFLLSDLNAKPGKRLYKLASANAESLPIGEQWLVLPLNLNTPLSPKTRYWIEVTASAPAGSLAYSRSHLGDGVAGEAYLNSYGLHQNSVTGPYIFKITASPSRAQ